jgi:hypothetical protein
MLRLRRPDKPAGFDKKMAPHRERVATAIRTNQKPDFEPPAWQDYKQHFSKAQNEKCAYCETLPLATSPGDVEHFRPKAAVSELGDDPETWGRERPGLANVEGRKPTRISDRGYWWLAYEWSNWLLSCGLCNRRWKGALFPIAENRQQSPPKPEDEETPLLLDPFGAENPAGHLRFDRLGQIQAAEDSVQGSETIRTLGLDREQLRRSRAEKAKRIHALIVRLDGLDGRERLDETWKDILEMGRSDTVHAGMVRIVFEQKTGLDWSILGALEDLRD